MKKYRRLVFLVFAVSLAFLVLFRISRNAGTRKWDISNLEMENDSGYCEIISFEDAVRLKTKLNNCNDEFAEKELRDSENKIFKSTEINWQPCKILSVCRSVYVPTN